MHSVVPVSLFGCMEKQEMETGNGNWKWKLKKEMEKKTHQSLVQCFPHGLMSSLLSCI